MKKYISILLLFTLISCVFYDREKYVDKRRLNGYDYRLFQSTPAWELAKAVQDENIFKVREIISNNPKLINYQDSIYGNTLLIMAIMNQNYQSFKELLANRADVSLYNKFDGSSAIIVACSSKHYDIKYVKLLVEYGANINDVEVGKRRSDSSVRLTPLIAASMTGNLELVKYLISKGADVNYRNEYFQTALTESVLRDNFEIAYFLLKNGANYRWPIFYRPDYTIPSDHIDPNKKGTPIYLDSLLKEVTTDLGTSENKYKKMILSFLKKKHFESTKE